MTTDCTRLDAYRDGRLAEPDAQAFETHAASCAACDAELLADDVGLSALADVACPPAVLDAALASVGRPSRRTGDRAAVPASRAGRTLRRLRLVPLALAAALALSTTIWLLPRDEAPAPDIARVEAPAPEAEPSPSLASSDSSEIPEASRPAPDSTLAPAADQPPRPTPLPRPVPATTPTAPSPDLVAATEPDADSPPDEVAEPEPSPDDVAAARRDLALAFALVADAQTQARDAIRDDASALTSTLDTALPF
ncbi:anti-sigma factor family protein [Rubrivirga sp. IMCC45206]|uniref:anti-sigma factor family protein n=1 Tax=Rubrivirga sp. IMCC45206 TaxID=3391614 RepID=UPI0039902085